MAKVRFAPNVPNYLALKDCQGRVVSGRKGEQTVYSLVDGRLLSVSTEIATQIKLLDIEAGELFGICKRWNGRRGHPVHWDVWRTPAAENARAAAEMEALGPLGVGSGIAASRVLS